MVQLQSVSLLTPDSRRRGRRPALPLCSLTRASCLSSPNGVGRGRRSQPASQPAIHCRWGAVSVGGRAAGVPTFTVLRIQLKDHEPNGRLATGDDGLVNVFQLKVRESRRTSGQAASVTAESFI